MSKSLNLHSRPDIGPEPQRRGRALAERGKDGLLNLLGVAPARQPQGQVIVAAEVSKLNPFSRRSISHSKIELARTTAHAHPHSHTYEEE